jgi:Tfp pilus assembly protein PilX
LQLDEVRLVRHQQDWWRALHVAEYALIEAERRVAGERGGAVTGGECRRIELRGAQDPCYVVEQLDADFRGECLFRVTVRARGDDERTVVRLQSLFSVGAQARRLAWTEVF